MLGERDDIKRNKEIRSDTARRLSCRKQEFTLENQRNKTMATTNKLKGVTKVQGRGPKLIRNRLRQIAKYNQRPKTNTHHLRLEVADLLTANQTDKSGGRCWMWLRFIVSVSFSDWSEQNFCLTHIFTGSSDWRTGPYKPLFLVIHCNHAVTALPEELTLDATTQMEKTLCDKRVILPI